MKIKFEETQYGFNYGTAEIERIHSDEKTGAVFLNIKTPKEKLEVKVTKTGKIRMYHEKLKS